MKKLFKILPIAFLFMIVSCDDNEGKVYQPNVDEFTFLTFDATAYTLPIKRDETGAITILFRASATSPVERTYGIEVVEEGSTADPQTYNLPTSITIPANEWIGSMEITGQDLGLVDNNAKPFIFKVTGLNDKEFMDNDTITVNVVEVCPFGQGATFLGNYVVNTLVASTVAGVPFATGSVVTLVETSEYGRTFTANYVPTAIANYSLTFGFTLACGEVIVNDMVTTIGCGGVAPFLELHPANVRGTYNPNDDSIIEIIYEESYGACGDPAEQIKFTLTKQ